MWNEVWKEVSNILVYLLQNYWFSLFCSFIAVTIIEYILKKIIESIVAGRGVTKSKKRIYFLKDYVYIFFQILAAIVLMRLAPIHRDIAIKVIDKIKYYELFAVDFFIYLAEVGLLYSVFFKIIIKKTKDRIKRKKEP